MANATPIISNFTSGELSPLLDGRTDISRYYNGVKTLENFVILPSGGIKRRPGTYYVAEARDSNRKSRLVPFQFSVTQAYIVEFADRYLRFYANQGQILSSGSAYDLASPYLEADLFDLQFAQDADTMWITHPSYKPRKLNRNAATWDSYTKLMLHCNGADAATTFTDEIGKTVTANGTAQIDTAQYKFGGASGLFDGDSDYLSLDDSDDWNFGTGDFTIDFWVRFNSIEDDTRYTFFNQYKAGVSNWRFMREGTGNQLQFQALTGATYNAWYTTVNEWKPDVDTWYHLEVVRNGSTCYIFINGVSQALTVTNTFGTLPDVAAELQIGKGIIDDYYVDGWMDEIRISKGIARHTANFTPETTAYSADVITFSLKNYTPELMTLDVEPGGSGWAAGDTITGNTSGETCEIVSVTDTTHYRIMNRSGTFTDGEVLTNGTDTADQGAGYPAFTGDPFGADSSDDCPACVSIHEQRIVFANTNNYPQKVWASVSGDYEDMTTGSDDADAYTYVIGSEQVNAIRWLSSGRKLALGTLGGVFSMSSGADDAAITPSNVFVQRETTYGSASLVPKKIGGFVYYLQRNSKTIREFGIDYSISDDYDSFDTMVLAGHISGDGITDIAYQQSPYNILWAVRDDGQLLCLTRQIKEEVLGWSRQILGGSFSGGDPVVESVAVIPGDGGDDEVWITVKRTIDSTTKRYVEYFKPMDYGDEQEDGFFVDCGLSLDVPKPITAITKANPGVVTATGHGFSNGDVVIIRGVVGMTEVNRTKYIVSGVVGDTFELTTAAAGADVDTSGYTTYISGGEVRKCVTSVSGLDHLVGETVDLFIDGDTATTAVVSAAGAVAITTPSNGGGEIHAGLRYTPKVKTMRIEAGSNLGSAQSKLKRTSKIFVRLYESLALKAGNDDTQDEFDLRDPGDSTTNPIPVFSGDHEVFMPSAWDRDGYVVITQDGPYPLNIIAIVIYLNVSD